MKIQYYINICQLLAPTFSIFFSCPAEEKFNEQGSVEQVMLFSWGVAWALLPKSFIWEHGILTQLSVAVAAAAAHGN